MSFIEPSSRPENFPLFPVGVPIRRFRLGPGFRVSGLHGRQMDRLDFRQGAGAQLGRIALAALCQLDNLAGHDIRHETGSRIGL